MTTATAISAAPAESTVPESPARPPRPVGNALAVALPVVALAVLGWRHRALTDDGTIFLRTVRQILAGNGPTVNLSERVEADTSTLWQWLLVAFGAVTPGDLGFTAVLAGILLTAAGLAVALDATRRLHTTAGPRHLLPAGALVLLAVPVFWDFAGSGLDSGLGTFCSPGAGGCWSARTAPPRPAAGWGTRCGRASGSSSGPILRDHDGGVPRRAVVGAAAPSAAGRRAARRGTRAARRVRDRPGGLLRPARPDARPHQGARRQRPRPRAPLRGGLRRAAVAVRAPRPPRRPGRGARAPLPSGARPVGRAARPGRGRRAARRVRRADRRRLHARTYAASRPGSSR
ncbi:hypothetical protein ACU686_22130 [Yinghuangia aomiensis]